jgi:hypothetical protein
MFWVTLAGLAGASRWHCQSDSWVGSRPKGFAFTNVDVRSELAQGAWMGLVKRLGVPITIGESDEALQARLVDAGLFDELGALRWGKHPYLPKVEFTPPGPEWLRGWLQSSGPAGAPPEFAERLQAHGLNLEEVMKQQMAQVEQKGPGRLTVWVEAGKERVPTPERFGELLDHAVRIAQINQQVNPASK